MWLYLVRWEWATNKWLIELGHHLIQMKAEYVYISIQIRFVNVSISHNLLWDWLWLYNSLGAKMTVDLFDMWR